MANLAKVRFIKHAYTGAKDWQPGEIGEFTKEACEHFVREGVASYDLKPAAKPEPAKPAEPVKPAAPAKEADKPAEAKKEDKP